MADYWAGTGDGPPDFGPPNPNAGKIIGEGLRRLPSVIAQSALGGVPASASTVPPPAPVNPAAPSANAALPAGIARRQVGDSQIYMSTGAHGEPVFSDTVKGAQQASTARGEGAIPSSLDATDPNVTYRNALARLDQSGDMVGRVPVRDPVVSPTNVMSNGDVTRRTVADLRAQPGGDTEWAQNTSGASPGDMLRMSPQARQGAINKMIADNAQPNADPATVAANRSALAVLDQSPRPGAYDPTGYAARNAMGASGFGAMSQKEMLDYLQRQQEAGTRAQSVENKAREFDANRADDLDKRGLDEITRNATAINKDNPGDPAAQSYGSIQYLLDHYNDPKMRGSAAFKQGMAALRSEMRAEGTPGLIGRIWGQPDMSQAALRQFDIQPNRNTLFGGSAKTVGPGGYSNNGGLIDNRFYNGSPVLDKLRSRPQNVDALRQILARLRAHPEEEQ